MAQAAGGPQVYVGRNMVESHKHLNITQLEWDALVGDFVSVLYKYKVPQAEQKELLTLVGSLKGQIVTAKSN